MHNLDCYHGCNKNWGKNVIVSKNYLTFCVHGPRVFIYLLNLIGLIHDCHMLKFHQEALVWENFFKLLAPFHEVILFIFAALVICSCASSKQGLVVELA